MACVKPRTKEQSLLLFMQYAFTQNWKKRWCIFTIFGNTEELFLEHFKNEEDAFYAPTPIKRTSLRNCKMIEVDLHHPSHKNIFAIHLPERVYYFSAPSRWVGMAGSRGHWDYLKFWLSVCILYLLYWNSRLGDCWEC